MVKENSNIYKLLIVAATIIWGASFVVVKNAVDVIPVNFLLAVRFLSAAAILALVFFKRMRANANWGHLWRGLVLGTALFTAYWFQTVGITDTTPGKNAFLTAAYVVLVPFFFWAVSKRKPDIFNVLAAILLIAGVGFVSLDGDFSVRFGDWMTLVGAIFYAIHIVCVARFSEKRDIFVLTVYQFAGAGLWAFIFSLATETAPPISVWTTDTILAILYLAILATAVALLFQNIGQKHTNPSVASILLSLESVFGVLFSIVFYGEAMTAQLVIGFVLIFIAVITSETKLAFLRRK